MPKPPTRTAIRAIAGAPLLISALLLSIPIAVVQAQEGTYRGRPVAPVMSYRGATWLEREGREAEEDPDQVLAVMELEGGETVADLGCGSGFFTRRMARAIEPGGIAYGVDIQPEMLRLLQQSSRAEGLRNVVPVLATEDDPWLPEGRMDWILLVDVYHELAEPEVMLRRIRDALAPDGRVALVEFRLHGQTAQHIKPEHRMSVEQVRKEWEPAGFELVRLIDTLPAQHLFIFKRASSEGAVPAAAEAPPR